MTTPLSDLAALLRSLDPALHEGVYVYASVPGSHVPDGLSVIAFIREPEGLSIVIPETEAFQAHLPILFRCAWITLTVNSDLQAVGLTAAFAAALGTAGISCNVVAGAYHDHLFVPVERAEQAMIELRKLQRSAWADFQHTEG
jgi:uncharacterized protein